MRGDTQRRRCESLYFLVARHWNQGRDAPTRRTQLAVVLCPVGRSGLGMEGEEVASQSSGDNSVAIPRLDLLFHSLDTSRRKSKFAVRCRVFSCVQPLESDFDPASRVEICRRCERFVGRFGFVID
ncbi:unnamed protein product, partial [Scytosiphon promiscuus]